MPQLATPDAAAPAATDRRTARRARPTYNTVFRSERPNGRPLTGLVWDLSAGGIGLLMPFAPAVGMTFAGDLRTDDGRVRLAASFTVAHVRRLATGDYFVGGKFARPLAESAVERFALPAPVEPPRPARTDADAQPADAQPAGHWRK